MASVILVAIYLLNRAASAQKSFSYSEYRQQPDAIT
jgi:hypothetical protein